MRNEHSTIERLRTHTSARRSARRTRRALEAYLSHDAVSPSARQEVEVILLRQDATL
jgi:hypothetical protein